MKSKKRPGRIKGEWDRNICFQNSELKNSKGEI
jgi:hypothetical protein